MPGMTGFDPFDAAPLPQPPDREFAQVDLGVGRCDENAVIAAEVDTQAALLKRPLKHGKGIAITGEGKRLAAQEKKRLAESVTISG